MSEGRISLLEKEVISKLRSGFNITSVQECVRELIQNSLDSFPPSSSSSSSSSSSPSPFLSSAALSCLPLASQPRVEVRVELEKREVQVRDNGEGILPQEMGHVALRYHSSKSPSASSPSYGFRGEALASMAEVSVLEIHSLRGWSFTSFFRA